MREQDAVSGKKPEAGGQREEGPVMWEWVDYLREMNLASVLLRLVAAMLFGGFHAGNPGAVSTQLILGSSSASFLWFFGITILISCFSAKFNNKILRIINLICGVIMIFYGCKLLWQFFQMVV